MKKVVDLETIKPLFKDGMTIMVGGFLGCGAPERLIDLIMELKLKDLTIIVNDTAFPDRGVGRLVGKGIIKKVICSHVGTNPESKRCLNAGLMEVEFYPQGTLIEKIRAQGFGLGGILTPTGIGTPVEEGKQKVTVNGQEFILEPPLKADLAIIKGTKVDEFGNVFYSKSTRNYNPTVAMAADITICEAQELVKVGEIDKDIVHTPGIFVNYIIEGVVA